MSRIAIDLTPILPGGENGGAKVMTLQLVKQLALAAPKHKFILLATEKNFPELETIKAPNIKTVCVSSAQLSIPVMLLGLLITPFKNAFKKILPSYIKARVGYIYNKLRHQIMAKNLKQQAADILFCPFTAVFYRDAKIPTVSVIYDLQSTYYPYFFSTEECYERRKHFTDACQYADRLVCISNFVRETVIENSSISPEKVKTIYINLSQRLPTAPDTVIASVLNRHKLTKNNFLLFPANFWLHKNHDMLLTAFGMYRAQHPHSTLKLVCTGTSNERKKHLLDAINAMGLSHAVVMPGYLSEEEFSALMACCRAVIFPSLYEGFGMPVLEAMACGKPVLCSNVTSLPEVAGNAALLFDPKKPTEIVAAIKRIEHESELADKLIKSGYERLAIFGNETEMAKQYLQVFQEAIKAHRQTKIKTH